MWELRLDYGRSPHAYVNQRLQIQLELLMTSGMPLETCSAVNERWNNKFCYKVASCWLFLLSHTLNMIMIFKILHNFPRTQDSRPRPNDCHNWATLERTVERELSTDRGRYMVRSREFFRSLGIASRLFRFLKVSVVCRAPDRQWIVLNAKPDADLFGSGHVTVCATWPLVKFAEFDNRPMWISFILISIQRVLQWHHVYGNSVTVINSPILSWFRVRPTQEPIHCQCDDHVLLSWTNHQPLGLVSSGRQLSPFLVTEQ